MITRSSAYPLIVAEEDYASGTTLWSGAKRDTALSVRRTQIAVANPDVGLGFGYRPGLIIRLHLASHQGSVIAQGQKRLEVPPRRVAETSFRRVTEACYWPVEFPIDQLRFELPDAALSRWLEDHRRASSTQLDLRSGSSVTDNVLYSFGQAALMSLQKPDRGSQFFIDHILTGVCAYLFEKFCAQTNRMLNGGLAPWQERRAKELMESRLGSDLSLEELASACRLSVAHFARAFRKSVGITPHKWLVGRRIATAQRLLLDTEKPLIQIAADCGFADQAHFTNVFNRVTGAPPGAFRRKRMASPSGRRRTTMGSRALPR